MVNKDAPGDSENAISRQSKPKSLARGLEDSSEHGLLPTEPVLKEFLSCEIERFSLTQIRQSFVKCFSDNGFCIEPAAKISSGIDPSVIFIGSNISSLKKFLFDGIPPEGVVIDQPSMRFRELPRLFDTHYTPNYGAFFNEIGVIARYENPERLALQLREYLLGFLGLSEQSIVIRVSSLDDDLLDIASRSFLLLEKDSKPSGYYRHTIGEAGYYGRNFNIALKNAQSGLFQDIGNFLAFQKDGEDAFLEVALGDTVIQRALCGYDHVLDCYQMKIPSVLSRIEVLNFKNSIIVTTVLYREGLRASNKNIQERILSKFLRYIYMLTVSKGVSPRHIAEAISSFEDGYWGYRSDVEPIVLADLERKAASFKKTLSQNSAETNC
jgi:hypothetical protein